MRLGLVGLGKMGGNMAVRLLRGGHEVVTFDRNPPKVAAAEAEGAIGAASLEAVVEALEPPRVVWLMIAAGAPTQGSIDRLAELLEPGDIVVDGGNARWTDSVARHAQLAGHGLRFVDAGTSGGIWGLAEGYCLMVGAEEDAFAVLEPALATLAPPEGYARVGPPGAGHFTKMVHNGVEYALMQSYAEGFELLRAAPFTPSAGGNEPAIDVRQVAELWRRGSVVRSWLLDLAARALTEDPQLQQLDAWVADSGEGRWTVQTAVDLAVPAPTISAALFERFASRGENRFGYRLLAALRQQFGGHAVKPADD